MMKHSAKGIELTTVKRVFVACSMQITSHDVVNSTGRTTTKFRHGTQAQCSYDAADKGVTHMSIPWPSFSAGESWAAEMRMSVSTQRRLVCGENCLRG